jgi:signal transduction histidine kinase/DNA-binding response OmpR family regulator
MDNTDEDFLYLIKNGIKQKLSVPQLFEKNIDFILQVNFEKNIINKSFKENVFIPDKTLTLNDFKNSNPFAVIKTYKNPDGTIYYYGRIIDPQILNDFSKRVGADIALVWNNTIPLMSNESQNQQYLFALNTAFKDLVTKNNFKVFSQKAEDTDILVTICKPSSNIEDLYNNISFLVFTTLNEAADLRSSLKEIMLILGFSGILISLILTFLFTDRIRKQISDLSKATEVIKAGNFQNKIIVKSKDELGELANAFNLMVTELEKSQKSKNEYSEFMTMLNQNPSLKEISDAALGKIINTCGFIIGALYTIEDDGIKMAGSFGIAKEHTPVNYDFYESVIRKREMLELKFEETPPSITTGSLKIELRYLFLVPIIYNSKVIAILELSGTDKPGIEAKEYIASIQEQLAIGLTNAIAFVQLEKLVTELKQLNEDYQKQNVQIMKQNETLVDLHKKLKEKADELEIQKEKAVESTKLKSQFLASMSHELRTPMNSILGLTELILEEDIIKGKNRERIEVVLKSARRLMNLINDILDLSKIEAGKMEIHNEDILLEDLIKEVEYSISPLLINKKIDFRVFRDTDTSIIMNTDRGKVTQVLINLLGNAVKFTESGFIEMGIMPVENNKLIFKIIDSGIGISEADQKVIFEEFRQVDGSITKKYSGTGLGLTICKKIADLLEGSISVNSQSGKGSTFIFTIPLNFVGKSKSAIKTSISVIQPVEKRKYPILVIEDDDDVRYTIGQYLSSRGYDVLFAADSMGGIEEAKKHQPFMIVLDVILPGKDGWDILRELKNLKSTKNIPVIVISILGDKNFGYSLGASEYMSKPFSSEQLFSAISKIESVTRKRIEKIVLVDNDNSGYENFRNEFNKGKISIDYIQDSTIAYNRIIETQPDMVIISLIMPEVDGITLTYKLKANKETKHIPVVICTDVNITDKEKIELNDIVEKITVKSKGHPLDVLKVVRDSIKMYEFSSPPDQNTIEIDEVSTPVENINPGKTTNNFIGEVLVVDDDPDTLFTINEILESCNCKTYLVRGGKECLAMLEKITPNIILLDIMMPEMDGFQTIANIKMHPRWANIPVFAVTAKAMLEDKEVILKNGFDDYIPKPINSSMLSFKIKKALSNLNLS